MGQVEAAAALPGGGRAYGRFRAVLNVVVPEAGTLSEEEWHEAQVIIASALALRPAAVRRQVGLFMHLLDAVAFVRHGRALAALSTGDATHLLGALSKSKFVLLRRGVWGVRTLAFMGYYARTEAASAIGYRAAAGGWSARRGASAIHG
jgi:hypothetical protein